MKKFVKDLSNIAVFDIEAANRSHKKVSLNIDFECLGFFDGVEYKVFASIERFLNCIDNRKYRGFKFYSHNGGRYDMLFLFKSLFERNWELKIVERVGMVVAIYVRTKNTNFILCDSYALLPDSLARLTKGFNVEHQKLTGDVDYSHISRHDKKLLKYLENDVLGLYEVLTTFFNNDLICKPQLTIASQALDTFRNLFLPCDLKRVNLEKETYFRQNFYAGGRVEVFKGKGRVNVYDVNSLFPFVMLNEMPCGECRTTTTYHKDKIGFYKVWIEKLPDWYISPLLIKRMVKNSQKNYYTNGKGEYYLSSATLQYLSSEFGIRYKVIEGFYFTKRERIFDDYVHTFYKMKNENKGNVLYYIAKYFLNSLYGKFGQMRWKESVEVWHEGIRDFVTFDNDFGLVLVTKESHSKFILPYVASYITDLARLHHYKLMMQHERSMFYCDTDSLFTTARYKTGTNIGDLSFEGNWDAIFLSPKSYALKDGRKEEITFKGFDVNQFSFADFKKSLNNPMMKLHQERQRLLSFRECLNHEQTKRKGKTSKRKIIHQASPFLKLAESKKVVTSVYDKRELYDDAKFGFDSSPKNWWPE